MKIKLPLLLIFMVLFSSLEGINAQDFWKKLDKNNVLIQEQEIYQKENFPSKYELFSLDIAALKNKLNSKSINSEKIILLPNSIGGFSKFRVKETSNLEDGLAEKFPMIKSYSAQGINDPSAVAKISLGTDGLHITVFSAKVSTFHINPYTKDNSRFIAYKREDLDHTTKDFKCQLEEKSGLNRQTENFNARNANDGKLRTFRLAMVCTGEYAQYHLTKQGVAEAATDVVKKAAVLSAMNTSMTRINGVYERDLGVRMVLVADNDKVVFLDPTTDNLSNGNTGALIGESQTVCDAEIGSANYDIGHLVSLEPGNGSGDGVAGLGVVCRDGEKGRGVTSKPDPIGDFYDIDFIAHEMGHQFGANHTQNNGCNRNSSTAVEPGSASTIMGYAGICLPNVQDNSDDHFHAVSITEMWNRIQSTATCAVLSDTNNAAPTANAGADFSIPKSTPFVLRGTATDANGLSSLTYNWEQIDNQVASMPPLATSSGGPMFRSLPSKTTPNRYMPDLTTVVAGNTSTTWEVLPSVARDLNFSFLVRDNHAGGGNSARDDVKISVTNADAFTVSTPNSAVSWDVDTSQTITWNKGTTDASPINCQNVNIKLSIDGGITFPIILKSNTPNDGTEDVVIPNNATTTARIMVEAADNIFYNVNSTNFTISSTEPTFVISSSEKDKTVCNTVGLTAVYNFNFEYLNGFTESVTLTANGNPTGTSVTFNPTSITSASGTSTAFTMTISDLQNASIGNYTIGVTGTSATITKMLDLELRLYSETFTSILLTSPENAATEVVFKPEFKWENNTNATSYVLEIADDSNFTNLVVNKEVVDNSYKLTSDLNESTVYYWRVKAKNLCGEKYSATRTFTTVKCAKCISSATNSDNTSTTLVKFNTINNVTAKPAGYTFYENIKTEVKRGETHQLTVNVNTDGLKRTQTKVWIDWNQDCDFTGAGEEYDLGSTEDKANDATSLSPVTITIPNDAVFGDVFMRVTTRTTSPFAVTYPTSCENGFVGEVEDYIIQVIDPTASIEDVAFEGFNLFPNPTKGEFTLNLKVVNTDKVSIQLFDVRGRLIDEKKYLNTVANFSERIFFEKASAGLYLLKVTNGNKHTTRKLIIK